MPFGLVLAFPFEESFWHAVKFGDTTLSRGGLGQGSRPKAWFIYPWPFRRAKYLWRIL